MPKPVLIHIDCPVEMPLDSRVRVRGWVASDARLVSVAAGSLDGGVVLPWEERPDVAGANPAYVHTSGFCGVVDAAILGAGRLVVRCETGSGASFLELQLPSPRPPPDKAARLARIRPRLRKGLACRETPFHFDFLTPELRARFRVTDTEAVSNFEYAPAVREQIDRCGDELVLDCGAGNRPSTWPNIVNLEIVAYPSTDVLAVNESLPFEDDTFAMVVSCAVLEHVKDPFAAAREMIRVTRPGGVIYADIPFLQPFHGYPSHYYNMTLEGAKNLFAGPCRIEREFVPHYGLPVWALTWFLNSYAAGLQGETRERFLRMRVSELTGPAAGYLGESWVRELSAQKNIELACATSVVARKI
jgi:SAM-dependent methyltransferase